MTVAGTSAGATKRCFERQYLGPRGPVRLGRSGRAGLVTVLPEVPDPRDARSVRHRLPVLAPMAVLC